MIDRQAEARAEHSDFMERFGKILETATKFKAAMKKRGLTRAKAKCPHCESGYLQGHIVGRKGHFHMGCDGCDAGMME